MDALRVKMEVLANNQRTLASILEHILTKLDGIQSDACLKKIRHVERALDKHFETGKE